MKPVRTACIIAVLCFSQALLRGQDVPTESFQGRDAVAGEIIVRFRAVAAAVGRAQTVRDPDTASADPVGRNGAMLVRSRSRKTADLIASYAMRPDVEYAEPNYIWRKTDFPNDPQFFEQWGLHNVGGNLFNQPGTAGADIHALTAWDKTTGSRGIVVGVVDSGIDYTHQDLIQNLWSAPHAFDVIINGQTIHCEAGTHGFNAINRTCDPRDDDPQGHGTHVSGIIGATGNNAIGVSGVSRIASVMALKFLGSSGSGTTADAIAAIEFAIQAKAAVGANIQILNNSWGGSGFSQALLDEINSANTQGMLFVVAAGNDSSNTDMQPDFPSSFNAPNLISVAATDRQDALATFSNFGASTVHLGAPGVLILSTVPGNSYLYYDGTSMAAPMVAGAAALVLASCSMTTAQLKADLLSTVDPVPSLQGKIVTGGRLNASAAIDACSSAGSTFSLTMDPPTILAIAHQGGQSSVKITLAGTGGFADRVFLSTGTLPSGVLATFNPTSLHDGESSILTLEMLDPNPGVYDIPIVGTTPILNKFTPLSLAVESAFGPPISTGSFSLSATDARSPERPGSFADFYAVTIPSSTLMKIDMRSTDFDPILYLYSVSGTLLATDDNSAGGVNARIGPVMLAGGTYFIQASSVDAGATGSYYFSVNSPTLDTISPTSAKAGTTVNLQLKGSAFVSPAKLNTTSGQTLTNAVTVVDSQNITATYVIPQDIPPGPRQVAVDSGIGGTSNAVTFTITADPVITSINPQIGVPGTTENIGLTGFGFTPDMTVSAGDGIVVSSINASTITASMTFTIAANASQGSHDVGFMTSVGTSNTVPFTVTGAPPTLTGISPSAGTVGTVVTVIVAGTNFSVPLSMSAGSGVNVLGPPTLISGAQARVNLQIVSNATVGPHNVTVTTPAGTSNPITFTVNPVYATLNSISPDHGGQGSTVNMLLNGSSFTAPMTVDAGNDIAVSNVVVVNTFSATATLAIAGNAVLGPRPITVATPVGPGNNALTFTVSTPFPDLVIADSRAGSFGSGFSETYSVVVGNIGSAATSGTTTVTYSFGSALPAGSVTGAGSGWSCTSSGATVTCITSVLLVPGSQSAIVFTVLTGTFEGTLPSTFSVSTTGDLNTSNNSLTDATPVVGLPQANISAGSVTQSATQGNVAITFTTFPHPLNGTLSLAFAPSGANPVDDPSIQFSTGGRQVAFTIPANSSQVLFAGATSLAFQSGTIAGKITISATIQSDGTVQPPAITSKQINILPAPPAITSFTKDTQSGLTMTFTLLSNTRDMTSVAFTFYVDKNIQLSCGSIPGCAASSTTITFDVRSLFSMWYAANSVYGSVGKLTMPFTYDGILKGSVGVTLTNSAGASNFSYPIF